MPYRGGSLVPLFSRETTAPPTTRLLEGVADRAGYTMTELARANTPKRTGRLAAKWRQIPTHETDHGGERAFVSGATNPDHRARWVEDGTEAHDLRPKRARALDTPEGPRAGAHHPGAEAQHPLAHAAHETEIVWRALGEPLLHEWADEIEAAAKRHKGIS